MTSVPATNTERASTKAGLRCGGSREAFARPCETLTRSATAEAGSKAFSTPSEGRRARSRKSGQLPPREPIAAPDPAVWLCGLFQAADSFYPTGSYAHSYGLEALVQDGAVRDRETLRQYLLLSAVPALRQVELPIAACAWRALEEPDWSRLGELCVLSSALRTPREARLASENIGRQRVELVAALRPAPLAAEFCRRAAVQSWPGAAAVSAALEGRVLGAPLPAVLAGVYYTSVAALLSAAMKLLRLGQNGAQSLLTELLAAAPTVIAAAECVSFAEIGWFNPWLDIAAARHESADARMFIS